MTRPCRTIWSIAAALGLVSLLSGCGVCVHCSAERYDQGLVVVLPGIEGRSVFNDAIVGGLYKAGVPYAIELHDWTSGLFVLFLPHLISYDLNRYAARRIAERLVRYAHAYPDRPIWVVGQSGGGGVGVLVLEQLPPGMQVEGAVLLAPALGPHYNLTSAMRHCRRAIYHYYSPGDLLFLGLGTTVFGTIDRAHGSAAGRVGFRTPYGLTPEERGTYASRLVQVDCSQGHFQGHVGLHLTSSNADFIAYTVAVPMLQGVPMAVRMRVAGRTATRASGQVASVGAAPSRPTTPKPPPRPGRRASVVRRRTPVATDARPQASEATALAMRSAMLPPAADPSGASLHRNGSHVDWQPLDSEAQVPEPRRHATVAGPPNPSVQRPSVVALPGPAQARAAVASRRSFRPVAVDRGPDHMGGPMGAAFPARAPAPSAQWEPAAIRPTTQRSAIPLLETPAPAACRLIQETNRPEDRPAWFRDTIRE